MKEKWYLLIQNNPEGIEDIYGIFKTKEELLETAKKIIKVLKEFYPKCKKPSELVKEKLKSANIPLDWFDLPYSLHDIDVAILVKEDGMLISKIYFDDETIELKKIIDEEIEKEN